MKISVITAVYNSAATVSGAIASVASQTHPDVEHVVVEGLSSDGSLAAIKAAQHDRMVLISEADKGIYDALNKGIRAASGDIVGFVHADDFLAHPNALARVAEAFEDPEINGVYADLDYVSQSDETKIIRAWRTGAYSAQRLRRGWMPAHPTLYLRKSVYNALGAYDTGLKIAADYDFVLRYFTSGTAHTVHIPEVLYKMRLGGVSNRNLAKVMQKMKEDYGAISRNRVGGLGTLAIKNLSKLGQFTAARRK
jgi:glycosyltransferase